MNSNDSKEMLITATEFFKENRYSEAETILNQLILNSQKDPQIFHMLGTIYYDKGKFNKAIRAFKRALEVDPSFTDASVGLSIILNDLGRYEEGKQVFEDAKSMLDDSSKQADPYLDEKLSIKHDELADMYYQHGRFKEALEQYYKSLNLTSRRAEVVMHIVDCQIELEQNKEAMKNLRELIVDFPDFYPARIKLGKIYYDNQQVPEAITTWEEVLRKDPQNQHAREYLRLANALDVVRMAEPSAEA